MCWQMLAGKGHSDEIAFCPSLVLRGCSGSDGGKAAAVLVCGCHGFFMLGTACRCTFPAYFP